MSSFSTAFKAVDAFWRCFSCSDGGMSSSFRSKSLLWYTFLWPLWCTGELVVVIVWEAFKRRRELLLYYYWCCCLFWNGLWCAAAGIFKLIASAKLDCLFRQLMLVQLAEVFSRSSTWLRREEKLFLLKLRLYSSSFKKFDYDVLREGDLSTGGEVFQACSSPSSPLLPPLLLLCGRESAI